MALGGRFQLQRLAAVQLPVEETEPNQLKPSREGFTLHKRKGQAIGGCELWTTGSGGQSWRPAKTKAADDIDWELVKRKGSPN